MKFLKLFWQLFLDERGQVPVEGDSPTGPSPAEGEPVPAPVEEPGEPSLPEAAKTGDF